MPTFVQLADKAENTLSPLQIERIHTDAVEMLKWVGKTDLRGHLHKALHGSMDAAAHIHQAVIPHWEWTACSVKSDGVPFFEVEITLYNQRGAFQTAITSGASTVGAAWMAAIFRAKAKGA